MPAQIWRRSWKRICGSPAFFLASVNRECSSQYESDKGNERRYGRAGEATGSSLLVPLFASVAATDSVGVRGDKEGSARISDIRSPL